MINMGKWHDRETVVLENEFFTAELVPSLGDNLFKLFDKLAKREVLRVPQSPKDLIEKPGHWGTPLLLPPNRIRNGHFKFDGREYSLEINTPNGHHIHGFLRNHPWRVTKCEEVDSIVRVTCEFRTKDFPEIVKGYPNDLIICVTYEIRGRKLLQKTAVHNEGNTNAPIGYGLHTWFMIDGEPSRWSLKLPVESIWGLDSDLMPSGELLPLGNHSALINGLNLKGQDFDTVFRIGKNKPLGVLTRDDGYTISYTPSEHFLHWVIYTMGVSKDVICLEPYTWVTNAPNLDMDPKITGMRSLSPGDTLSMDVLLEIEG